MKFIRFDSVGGASGDMILGVLIGLGVPSEVIEDALRSLIPGEFHIRTEVVPSYGIWGTRVTVELPQGDDVHSHVPNRDLGSEPAHKHASHHRVSHCQKLQNQEHAANLERFHDRVDHGAHAGHHHRSFADIRKMIESSSLSAEVKQDAVAVFCALAVAEGAVHGTPPEKVLFHEVGAVDSIVDIVGAVFAFHYLGIEAITVGPIPLGTGSVQCAHGIYPVPAPAVVALLETFRLRFSLDGAEGEMLTPTGAALLGWWRKVPEFQILSATVEKSANALGHREYPDRPNLLRGFLVEVPDFPRRSSIAETSETLVQLDVNLDDVSGEILSDAAKRLLDAGALDVWFTPIQMKKGRPAVMLSLLLPPNRRDALLEMIFLQTGSFGVREEIVRRYALRRRFQRVMTSGGEVTIKTAQGDGKEIHFAPEFDECRIAAEAVGTSSMKIYREAVHEYLSGRIIDRKTPESSEEIT
ncbi:MAG: nickel pincer cofactor biosynthesis protein LarC [Thermoguttaceae bacterium]